jgi:hypothetical protein
VGGLLKTVLQGTAPLCCGLSRAGVGTLGIRRLQLAAEDGGDLQVCLLIFTPPVPAGARGGSVLLSHILRPALGGGWD